MDLRLDSQYEDLRQEVREFLVAHREQAPGESADTMSVEGRVWQRLLVDNGFVGRTVPREYGGYGAPADLLETLVIQEEFAAARVSLGMRNQGIDMFVPTLLVFGNEEQKKSWVGPTLCGDIIWCQGYSEPEAGSDLASLRTAAMIDGDDYVVNGQKIWTSTAQSADWMFALVRTEPEAPKHRGISYLVLPMSLSGIEVRPLRTMNGESSFNEVFFTDVRVPRSNVIGQPGQGWEVGTTTLRFERGMLGSPLLSERLYRGCAEVIRQAGLLDDEVFRDRLMRLQGRLLAMKYHGQRLLSDRLAGRDSGVSSLIVKLNGCQLNYDLCGLAIDAMGERGLLQTGSPRVVDDGAWQRTHMYSLGLIIGGGTAQIQKNIIAEVGLGLPREPKAAS